LSGKLLSELNQRFDADPAEAVLNEYDVLVYGATAGGLIAAVAAAREGATVIVLEPGRHLGGMVTGGLGATDSGNASAIGGITREYFERIGARYGAEGPTWQHEAHVAEDVFKTMVREAGIVVVFGAAIKEAGAVHKEAHRIVSVTTESGNVYRAKQFIDATYEADLMAQSGVAYTVGREDVDQYGEKRAGIRPPVKFGYPGCAFDEHGLLPDIDDGPYGEVGTHDHRIMAYTFRLCLTNRPDNRITFEKPEGYDPRRYALLRHVFEARPDAKLSDFILPVDIPNGKIDANNRPGLIVSTNLHNGSWDYPEASYDRRRQIWREHESYVRGFFYYLANDGVVPEALRSEVAQWGLPRDEFQDLGGWPHQLYVRAGRRMIGERVMTAHDMLKHTNKPDAIAMGTYFLDSHRTRRTVMADGDIATEGGVGGEVSPYDIPYNSITPKPNECENLLVPICLSSSGIAWCSLRMEPVFMVLGHAAGVAAAMTARSKHPVQDVDIKQLQKRLQTQNQVIGKTDLPTMKEHHHSALLVPVVEVTDPSTLLLSGQKRTASRSI
jgi:FAD dependent oxidoreductase